MAGQEFDLEAIVREVFRRLQDGGGAQAGGEGGDSDGAGTAQPTSAAPPVAPAAPVAPEPGRLSIAHRTITLELVKGRLQGVREVLIPAGAVVTPSVRDELRKRQIALRFHDGSASHASAPAGVVLGIAGPRRIAGAALAAVTAETAGATRIDSDCVVDVIRQVSQAMTRRGWIGLVLTDRPALALCLANRWSDLRAAWGVNVVSVGEAARWIGANLLIIDPSQHGLYELRGMIREFVAGRHECPEAYREALGGTP